MHEGIKKRYPRKNRYITVVGQSSVKRLQISMDLLPITTSTSDELFSPINIDNFERSRTSKIRGFIDFLRSLAAAHTPRMNGDEIAENRLTVCKQELL